MSARRRSGHSRWLAAAALVGSLAVHGCADVGASADTVSASPGAGVAESEVVTGALDRHLVLTGELIADQSTALIVPNIGVWPVQIRWLVEDGTVVEVGDRLVEFDNGQLLSQRDDLRTSWVEAENQLAAEQSRVAADVGSKAFTLEQKRSELEIAQLEAAVPENMLAALELDRLQLALSKAELELRHAENAIDSAAAAGNSAIEAQGMVVKKAQLALQRAEQAMESIELTAPVAGIVLAGFDRRQGRAYRSGDNSFPGSTVAEIPDLETLMVEADLFDVDDGRIEPGMKVIATLDAFPDQQLPGSVRSIDAIADTTESRGMRRAFRVRIDLEGLDSERTRPGMSVRAEVELAPIEGLLVPRSALRWTGDLVEARRADGSWTEITIGDCARHACELRSGLELGDRLMPEGAGMGAAVGAR